MCCNSPPLLEKVYVTFSAVAVNNINYYFNNYLLQTGIEMSNAIIPLSPN